MGPEENSSAAKPWPQRTGEGRGGGRLCWEVARALSASAGRAMPYQAHG